MAGKLAIDHDAVVGKLLRIWIWADQQSANGHEICVTESFIDRLTFCRGFAAALRHVGWLEGRDGRLSIPNFDRHNGQSAKRRAEAADRKRKSREMSAECHKKSVTETSGKRDQRREEKRREVIPPKSPKGEKKGRGSSPSAETLIAEIPDDFPDSHRGPAQDWAVDKQSRGQTRQRFQSTNAWKKSLARMARYPAHVLADAVEQAIASGWQGWEQENIKEHLDAGKPSPGDSPDWLPENWRDIAADLTGQPADSFADYREIHRSAEHGYQFELRCRGRDAA